MRGCHRCKHAAEVAVGKYAETAWEETPCAGCPDFRYGRVIGLDENEVGDEGPAPEGDAESEEPEVGVDDGLADPSEVPDDGGETGASQGPRNEDGAEPVLPAWVMVEFTRMLMELSPKLRDAVCLRYQGRTFAEIGRELRLTQDAARRRVSRAVARWPALEELLPRIAGGERWQA